MSPLSGARSLLHGHGVAGAVCCFVLFPPWCASLLTLCHRCVRVVHCTGGTSRGVRPPVHRAGAVAVQRHVCSQHNEPRSIVLGTAHALHSSLLKTSHALQGMSSNYLRCDDFSHGVFNNSTRNLWCVQARHWCHQEPHARTACCVSDVAAGTGLWRFRWPFFEIT